MTSSLADSLGLPPLPPLPVAGARSSGARGEILAGEALERTFRGPTDRSNWVVPGRVLCGDQAVSLDDPAGRAGCWRAA